MDTVSAEQFLLDQIPQRYRPLIPTTLKTAYQAAEKLIESEPILKVASAVDNRGRIVSWAVDFAFMKLLETQRWPFDYRWCDFAKPTGRYLEIRLSHSVLTVSQVADPGSQPRNAVFRENGRLNNEPFFDLEEFADERIVKGIPHFLMIHGHQQLNFAHLAVPHALHHRDFIYRTPNLIRMPHEVITDAPAVEATDFDAAMTLKEEIEKWRRDHEG